MKKKLLLLIAATIVGASLAGCGSSGGSTEAGTEVNSEAEATTEGETEGTALSELKAGFIFLHDENSTYDLNFMNAAKEACEKLGVEMVSKTNIPEGQEAYEAACELADAGCDFVFADSF